MRLIEFSRGFAFRIGAITAGLILVSMLALGSAIYSLIDDSLEEREAARIEQQMQRLLETETQVDARSVITEIERLTRPEGTRRFTYRVADADGRHVAGDPLPGAIRPGWSKIQIPDRIGTTLNSRHLLVFTAPIGARHTLSIGRDVQWISDVEDELLRLLLWSLPLGVALAAATAWISNHLVARRIDLVTDSAVTIMDGNLRHRVPSTGADDDFDRLSKTLNEMLDRIQGLIGNVEQITNDIAHDLRTPLGRLRQGLELARSEASTTAEYAQSVDRAISEADGLLSTFTSMLRIAQVEAGAQRSAFRKIDLSDVMRSVAEAYEAVAEEKEHRLESTIADGVELFGDRDLLVQLFANLIENALTHTPAGSTIRLALERSSNGIVAIVADNGPGIPAEEHDKVFQRFYRLESSRTTPGTGLGLSLVAAVAKLHGAHIDVSDNQPGLRISVTFQSDRFA